jgi:hypothetical protein
MKSFEFYTSVKLPEYVGVRARNVDELLDGIRKVDGSSIFQHTFHFLFQHHYAPSQPPSDFAYWVSVILLDHGLAERLAAINTIEFPTIQSLRERLIAVIEEHRGEHKCQTSSPDGMDFFFMRSNSVVVHTGQSAPDLPAFVHCLEKVSIGSIYHHLFEARLSRPMNDFSIWLEAHVAPQAARKIERLDPYVMTLEQIRRKIIEIVQEEEPNRVVQAG